MKRMLAMFLVAIMLLSFTAVSAQATTYKAKKVTAKQIVTELKKTGLIKKISKPGSDVTEVMKIPNNYKSKVTIQSARKLT